MNTIFNMVTMTYVIIIRQAKKLQTSKSQQLRLAFLNKAPSTRKIKGQSAKGGEVTRLTCWFNSQSGLAV